ncbi:MAG TPA: exodeoxyribonuclease III [Acetobacteraceae bacterium]|nr:exodeoxyribonuclease III [Acetobacteraceae bacterium]
MAPRSGFLRIATWNINSLRLRAPLLRRLVEALDPDVICLQETKVPDALFPDHVPEELGYRHVARRGMKGYNGVAILSRRPMAVDETAPDWCERGDCRHLGVRINTRSGPVELHNFYVPAGGDVADPEANPKFAHKLAFVEEARRWFADRRAAFARGMVVGDLNIAPLEHDVWSHRQLLTVVSHTPVEVAALGAWQAAGFVDAVRHFVPSSEKLYTWWSYRNQDWRASDRGRRLDHVWVTPDLVPALRGQTVLKEARDWPQSSDHVPVCVSLAV